ncbi:hypothetical protein DFH09DRAFT_42218 [Mycena vulgaris]|nr:hypothetical protein DFH09DRAFT_42218 [Mycena vulgaris]
MEYLVLPTPIRQIGSRLAGTHGEGKRDMTAEIETSPVSLPCHSIPLSAVPTTHFLLYTCFRCLTSSTLLAPRPAPLDAADDEEVWDLEGSREGGMTENTRGRGAARTARRGAKQPRFYGDRMHRDKALSVHSSASPRSYPGSVRSVFPSQMHCIITPRHQIHSIFLRFCARACIYVSKMQTFTYSTSGCMAFLFIGRGKQGYNQGKEERG